MLGNKRDETNEICWKKKNSVEVWKNILESSDIILIICEEVEKKLMDDKLEKRKKGRKKSRVEV